MQEHLHAHGFWFGLLEGQTQIYHACRSALPEQLGRRGRVEYQRKFAPPQQLLCHQGACKCALQPIVYTTAFGQHDHSRYSDQIGAGVVVASSPGVSGQTLGSIFLEGIPSRWPRVQANVHVTLPFHRELGLRQ